MKQLCDRVEFSLGHSNMARLRGALAEDLIGIAVQCSGVSGNIAFKPLIPQYMLFYRLRSYSLRLDCGQDTPDQPPDSAKQDSN